MRNERKNEFKKRLYTFVLELIKFIDLLPKDNVTRRLADQLLRSGTSILGNYIEAINAYSKREFGSFFNISLRSTKESLMWLALLRDSGRTTDIKVNWFIKELDEFSKIFTSSILTIKKRLK